MELNEPAMAYGKQRYTIAEYLEMENAATEKHEYYRGEVFAMSGAKQAHIEICGNVYGNLWSKLRGKPCKPYNSDTRIHIEQNTLFTYPDITVICGKAETRGNDKYNFLNPAVLFEILSESSRKYDRDEKFRLYRDIPSLKMYVMIDSQAVGAEVWQLNDAGKWTMSAYSSLDEIVLLPTIGIELTMQEIYEGVELE